MAKNDLKLLDCTLRDGGYINDWNWGFETAQDIIRSLVRAQIDVIEVGFLRNTDAYRKDVTVCERIEELNRLLPKETGNAMFAAMAMRSNYDVGKLSDYCGSGIEMIRITAHDYDIEAGFEFAQKVKDKGYRLSINPINIMGYSDDRILWILDRVNQIQPYQFSIVDTFGSMKRRDLDRIVSLVDHNLDRNIRVALHLHENMSLSCALAQEFADKRLNRPVAIDASLMGMGRTPGNLPIELIADYLNEYTDKAYDIDHLMDAIEDHIAPMKGETAWGYTPAYFLSAKFNLHRNYAEHYLAKGDLTNRDINHILARFEEQKKTAFDAAYADRLYEEYKAREIDDSADRERLKAALQGRKVLIVAPGASINTHREAIQSYIAEQHPAVLSVNFLPDGIPTDYAFFSNNKRFEKLGTAGCKTVGTSNLTAQTDYVVNYNSVSGAFREGLNSFVMLVKLLKDLDVSEIAAAGADGYSQNGPNYYSSSIRSYTEHGNRYNLAVAEAIRNLAVPIRFITPSAYEVNA